MIPLFTDGWFDQDQKKKKLELLATRKEPGEIDVERNELIKNYLVEKDLIIYRKDAELQKKDLLLAEKEKLILRQQNELQCKEFSLNKKEDNIVQRNNNYRNEKPPGKNLQKLDNIALAGEFFPAKIVIDLALKSGFG